MTPQMARGAQVAFGKSWLERRGIESQTVDVHSHIDSSLSYEENIKKFKRMLGMGGRSTQQATPTMTAGECDVAIGNYEAGYNGTTMKDACECGHPDACVDLERKKAKKASKGTGATPIPRPAQKDYKPATTWEEFVKINDPQITKVTAAIKRNVADIADAKNRERAFKKDIRAYKIRLTDIWSKTKAKAKPKSKTKTTSGTVEKFRQLLIKHPDRRVKTIERMRGVLVSHTLGRDFGGSMEDYYKQRPDLKRTDEGLQALITEAGRGTIKATPPPPAPKRRPPAAKPAKAKPQKAAPAGIALTATQKKRLNVTGRITVKRDGKFVTITKKV